jgi:RHS repeat-associated protein
VDVFTVQDAVATPSEPTEAMTFSQYGVTAFDVQYWTGAVWVTVPGGSVSGNNLVWRKVTFPAVRTSKVRVYINAALAGRSRLVEVEAWGPDAGSTTADVRWLVTDQLGTPRMILDQTGSLARVTRHDYLPFGEEISAGVGGRTKDQGYVGSIRQQFTGKERDVETMLDYFGARYYSSWQGRFASCDPITLSQTHFVNPQRWNLYVYVNNNPLALFDPDGRNPQGKGGGKVIDVFLTTKGHAETRGEVNGEKVKGPDWEGLKKIGRDHGVKVNIYTADDGNVSVSKVLRSLKTPGTTVIIMGHSQATSIADRKLELGKPIEGLGAGVLLNNGSLHPNGTDEVTARGGVRSAPLPEVKADNVGVFACDSGGTLPNLVSHMSGTLLYNDDGPDGLATFDANEHAAYAVAKTFATGGTIGEAQNAAQGAVDSFAYQTCGRYGHCNQGDRIQVQRRP